jgi:hypothetical protein
VTSNRLPVLAAEVREAHQAAREATRTAIDRAREAGLSLIEAKSLLDHGQWLPWLEQTGLSVRTAQKYMRIARMPEDKYAATAHLTIDRALAAAADVDEPPAITWWRRAHVAADQADAALEQLDAARTTDGIDRALKLIIKTCGAVIEARSMACDCSKLFNDDINDAYDDSSLNRNSAVLDWVHEHATLLSTFIDRVEDFGIRVDQVIGRARRRDDRVMI